MVLSETHSLVIAGLWVYLLARQMIIQNLWQFPLFYVAMNASFNFCNFLRAMNESWPSRDLNSLVRHCAQLP